MKNNLINVTMKGWSCQELTNEWYKEKRVTLSFDSIVLNRSKELNW